MVMEAPQDALQMTVAARLNGASLCPRDTTHSPERERQREREAERERMRERPRGSGLNSTLPLFIFLVSFLYTPFPLGEKPNPVYFFYRLEKLRYFSRF